MEKTTQEDYINYRLERAWKTFEDAKYLASKKSWNSSINRLYYACFYSVLALFSKYQIACHKHSGVKTQFSLYFIKTGLLDKEYGKLYGDLFDLRHKSDYGDFIEIEEKNVLSMIPKVEQFLYKIQFLIKNKDSK
ncbi:MAG TPA: HEPN domain-containing protein [Bacteroidales bacterium]|nr:HEPN domain-containing protein [Bacteroidales bacterium]HCI56377.1 hypothetical protein [Bacteroidales bacterium]HOU95704.1 HEPN domain-containing protein [Bacteroidales bacterium]HQG37343.1 HEPN domain-containing protein [Bacteroidales bacterium]HQG52129.1 HEPN domain-containing protein [Bacteroidales bacterium]